MALVALSKANSANKSTQPSLQTKALMCVCMVFVQRVDKLHREAWREFPYVEEADTPTEHSHSDVFYQPTFASFEAAVSSEGVDVAGTVLRNNVFDGNSLLEGPNEVMVVMGTGHGISHIKVGAPPGQASFTSLTSTTTLPTNIWRRVSRAVPPDQEPSCDDTLAFMGFMPQPNTGGGDCFWLSLQTHIGSVQQARKTVGRWLQSNIHHPAFCEADVLQAGGLTTEWQVNATVQAFQSALPSGLLVFHQPANTLILYAPQMAPVLLPMSAAVSFCCGDTPCLLYSRCETSACGHFELLRRTVESQSRPASASPVLPVVSASTLLLLPFVSGGMASDADFPMDLCVPLLIDNRTHQNRRFHNLNAPSVCFVDLCSPPIAQASPASPGGAVQASVPPDEADSEVICFEDFRSASSSCPPTELDSETNSSMESPLPAPLFGCSCIGHFGVCVCGWLRRVERHPHEPQTHRLLDFAPSPLEATRDFSGAFEADSVPEDFAPPANANSAPEMASGNPNMCVQSLPAMSPLRHVSASSPRSYGLLSMVPPMEVAPHTMSSRVEDDPIEDFDDLPGDAGHTPAMAGLTSATQTFFTRFYHLFSTRHTHPPAFSRVMLPRPNTPTLLDFDVPQAFASQASLDSPDDGAGRSASSSLPSIWGGMLASDSTPLATLGDSILAALLECGVPQALAQQAAAKFPTDLNAALDWVTESDRRHTCPRRSESSAPVPPAPSSWLSRINATPGVYLDLCTPSPQRPSPAPVEDEPAQSVALPPVPTSWVLPHQLLTVSQRASQYWASAREDALKAANHLYQQELLWASQPDRDLASRLVDGFLSLPAAPPQHFSSFGLTFDDLYSEELRLFHLRTSELADKALTVADACSIPFDVVGLCPFPLAVACILSSAADIAPEFLVVFFYSLAGWVCHHDLHAVFDLIKKDRRTRPRCMVQCICDSAAGKSPFWRGFVSLFFTGVDSHTSVFSSHPTLWADGGKKGLHIAQATDADLASRMMETEGKLFWASPECWLMLDTAHAKRFVDASKDKINFNLLECQNGNDYGPRSIKSCPQQIHVPTTNFGMLLLGQADCVHDFWGHAFSPGSPVRSKGFEGRPMFLFAGPARLLHQEQLISAETIYGFMKILLLNIARTVGRNVNTNFVDQPLQPANPMWWRQLKSAGLEAEEEAPACSQLAAAKWGYTCGAHIITNQLFLSSFASLPKNHVDLKRFLDGEEQGLVVQPPAPTAVPSSWQQLSDHAFLAAPRALSTFMSSLSIIYAEMQLPVEQRAGTKVVAAPGARPQAPPSFEHALSKALQRHRNKQHLHFNDIQTHINSKCRNQATYLQVFQLAADVGVGQLEGTGTRSDPYRLKLTLSNLSQANRARFGLEAELDHLPPMQGGGKRAQQASQPPKKKNKPGAGRPPAAHWLWKERS